VHFLDLGAESMVGPIAYAAASDLLFVAKRTTPPHGASGFHHVDVIRASTGGVLKTLDISPAYTSDSLARVTTVNSAGTRLFATELPGGTFAFDVGSGSLLASRPSLSALPVLEEFRNRLLVLTDGIAALSADSLALLGSVGLPQIPPPPPQQTSGTTRWRDLDVSGLSATIFVLESLFTRFATYNVCWSQLIALDAETGHVRRTVSTTDALGFGACGAGLVRVTEPSPPTAGTVDIAGHQVTLTWEPSLGATHYELEVGTAPGLANLATLTVTEPRFVVQAVPSGAYYLRVRAINTIGKSSASREIQVLVD
jgi:hypothetical protein